MEPVIDLEEAVGSYLNCLSTSCAAGSKLYTSVGKLIEEKFHQIFSDNETHNKYMKTSFQMLQTQNAFEGYQKALLECKENLLEVLIDSHTKKHNPRDKNKHGKSTEEQYMSMALRVAKELYCYHQTVADVLKPLVFSDFQEDFENATLTGVEGKDEVVAAWVTVSEANRPLRDGYGLSNQEIAQVLSWQHGEDVSETARKKLNQKITSLIQTYIDRLFCNALCEVDIPAAFNQYPDELQKVLKNCCSPAESYAASAQGIPAIKEEIEVMLHRELPRVSLYLNGNVYEKASPGKAFENTTNKMHAVRDLITSTISMKKLGITKEQIDLFCLRILAAASFSISSACSRTAVLMAFGKYNLVQAKPLLSSDGGEKSVYLDIRNGNIEVDVPSKWFIFEDSTLFKPLCRDKGIQPILSINVSYHVQMSIEDYLVKRIEPVPVARITQCVLRQSPSAQAKKEQNRERGKSIKIRLSKATTKLFNRKSINKDDAEADIIMNEHAKDTNENKSQKGNSYVSSSDSQDEDQPVPPPRHKRKAKKKKTNSIEEEDGDGDDEKKEKKEDFQWYSSSPKFGLPPLPKLLSGSTDQSPSIASFEELQGVIDFLSGSSSSSLAINEKSEKNRHPGKTHKRNNSMTSLTSDTKTGSKVTAEGKLKLCHKKSASFSGNPADLAEKSNDTNQVESTTKIEPLNSSDMCNKKEAVKENPVETDAVKKIEAVTGSSVSLPFDMNVVRTPGDGIDNKVVKAVFNSAVDIVTSSAPVKATTEVEKNELLEESLSSTALDKQEPEVMETSLIPVAVMENKPEQVPPPEEKIPERNERKDAPDNTQSNLSHVKAELSKLQLKDIEVTQSEPVGLHTLGLTQPLSHPTSNVLSTLNIPTKHMSRENSQETVSSLSRVERQAAGTIPAHSSGSVFPQTQIQLQQQQRQQQQQELQQLQMMSQPQQLPQRSSPSQPTMEQTLYEPFNSNLSWPVGLGQSKLGNLWSDATLDTDRPTSSSEKVSSQGNSRNLVECEFTLDKQQDFHKLLEGSRFFSGYKSGNESWKDRSYMPDQRNVLDRPQELSFGGLYEKQDPWPLSQAATPQRSASGFPNNNQYFTAQEKPRGIEGLHLPQNPVGPYMRQNREQLLAKQQILEQYARQQKQIQLKHQALSQRESNFKMGGGHINLDRVSSVPGMSSMNVGKPSSRYDLLPDRSQFHRPVNSQRSVPQQMHFGGGMSGIQSRSVSDMRMEGSSRSVSDMRMEGSGAFSQLSDHNLFREQFNQSTDMFSTQY